MSRKRRRLAFADWPATDRAVWEGLCRAGDILDDAGPFARLRPATREIRKTAYAFWLGFLAGECVELEAEAPADRMTDARLDRYLAALEGLSPASKAQRVFGLSLVFRAAWPNRAWPRLETAGLRLQRLESRRAARRSPAADVSAADLIRLGRDLMREADASVAAAPVDRALRARDGAAILLLAHCPIRITNLAALTLGETLHATAAGYSVALEPEVTKAGRPISFAIPHAPAAALERYLSAYRPCLARPGVSGDALWLATTGRPLAPYKLSERIATVTQQRLGVRVSAHRFRICAATTIAERAPEQAAIIQALLGHSTSDTADRAYNQAAMRHAVEAYAKTLETAIKSGERPQERWDPYQ